MARQNRDSKAITNTMQRNRLRSSLFRWMVKHHDEIVERWDGEKIDWRTFCSELAELELADVTGKPASARTARQTWLRVRGAVAKRRATEAAKPPRPIYPSRVEKDWRPPSAPPPPARTAPAGSPPLPQAAWQPELLPIRTDGLQDEAPYDPEEQMAHLRRTFRQRSGRQE